MGFEGRCFGDASVVRQWCVLPLHACVLIFFHRAFGAFLFFCEPELVGHLRLLRMATTLFLFLLGCFRFRVSMYGVWAFFLPLPLFSCRGLLIAFGGGRPLWAMFRNLR